MAIAPVAFDASEFNPYYTDAYGRRLLIFRAAFGAHYLDHHFLANANQAARDFKRGDIDGAVCYQVWLQSATPAQHYAFFWQQFGNKVPDWLMGYMADIERWGGTSYQNRGDHSKEINQLLAMNATKLKSIHAAWWYANKGDAAELMPHKDSRFWGIEAKYGPRIALDIPGAIGQQYTDGQAKWGVPAGYPTASAPFGHGDHNAFPGVKSFAALRQQVRPLAPVVVVNRPPAPTPPPVKPPAPAPAPTPYYHADAKAAGALVTPDGTGAWFPVGDKLVYRKLDPKLGHGVAERTL